MPFIGTQPDVGGYSVLDALTASATASYTLQLNSANFVPSSANQLLVSLNGVIQKPGSSFTVSGSTLTFSSALTSSDSIDFILAMGEPLLVGTPSDGTVTSAKLATGAAVANIGTGAIATAKLADDSVTGAKIASSAVTDAKIAGMAASKLSGSIGATSMPTGATVQVISVQGSTELSTTTNSYTLVPGMQIVITPSSSSNKILLMFTSEVTIQGDGHFRVRYTRGGSEIIEMYSGAGNFGSANQHGHGYAFNYLDSPNTTSATTYQLQAMETGNGTLRIPSESGYCSLTAIEIVG